MNGPNSDIDALCVAPRHIDRDAHFFGKLAKRLRENEQVTELNEVPNTMVPIIKMKFENVEIDLIFARI